MNISPFLWVPKAPKFVETLFLHHLLSSCIFPSSMAFGDFYKTDFVVKDLSDSLLFSKKVCLSDYLNTWFCKWYTLGKVKCNLSTFLIFLPWSLFRQDVSSWGYQPILWQLISDTHHKHSRRLAKDFEKKPEKNFAVSP